jgi:hypothetical protein
MAASSSSATPMTYLTVPSSFPHKLLFQVFTLHPEALLHVGDVVDVIPTLAVGLTQTEMATNSPIVVVLIQIAPTIVAVGVAEALLPSTELLDQFARFVTALGTLQLLITF